MLAIVATTLLVAGLLLSLTVARNLLFIDSRHFVAVIDNARGLRVGAPVRLAGIDVGQVDAVALSPDGEIELGLVVSREHAALVRADSVAMLRSSLFAKSHIDISAGSADAEALADGARITLEAEPTLDDIVAAVRGSAARVDTILDRIDDIVATAHASRGQITASLDKFHATSEEVRRLAETARAIAERGEGLAGRLGAIAERLSGADDGLGGLGDIVESLDGTLALLRGFIAAADQLVDHDVREVLVELDASARNIASAAGRIDAMLRDNEESLRFGAAESLVLLRGFVERSSTLLEVTTRLLERLESQPLGQALSGGSGGVRVE